MKMKTLSLAVAGAMASALMASAYANLPEGATVFNDAPTIEDLNDKLLQLHQAAQNIQAKADAENGRALTEDEEKEVAQIMDAFQSTELEIERRKSIAAMGERLGKPRPRATAPDDVPVVDDTGRAPQARRTPSVSGGTAAAIKDRGKWGFNSFGEFANAVRMASRQGGHVDPRLVANAPTTYGQEGVGADGGFAVPPDFRSEIMLKVMGEDSLIARTDGQTSSSNSFTFPKDETTPWQTSGGVQAYWESEAAQLQQSKPALQTTTVKLAKLTALVPVTEELLEDAPSLANYLRKKAPEKMDFKVSDAIVNGTGAGQPLGILGSPSLITVAAESGQAAATINFNNIVNMYARLYGPLRNGAVWLANQDIEPQLMTLSFPVSGGATAVPVYLPPGGLSAAPYGTLLGRPVIPTQACQALGDVGDLILVNLSQYLTITKTQGMRFDVSIHLYFDYDMQAFRFILRVGGQPWWSTAIAGAKAGTLTRSWAVALAQRS